MTTEIALHNTTEARVARIEAAYLKTRLLLEKSAHTCKPASDGLCPLCGVMATDD